MMWTSCMREIEYLVGHLVNNNVDTWFEERIHLVGFSFIRALTMQDFIIEAKTIIYILFIVFC